MNIVTVFLPDALREQIESRSRAGGFQSTEQYLLALVRADCEQADIEAVLEERWEGPFVPLEPDWKDRARAAASFTESPVPV